MADEGTGEERVTVGGTKVVVSRRDLTERDFDEHLDPFVSPTSHALT